MRTPLFAVFVLMVGGCSTSVTPFSTSATCAADYDRCVRREPNLETCGELRAQCVELAEAVDEERSEKQRGYEEFLKERERDQD